MVDDAIHSCAEKSTVIGDNNLRYWIEEFDLWQLWQEVYNGRDSLD